MNEVSIEIIKACISAAGTIAAAVAAALIAANKAGSIVKESVKANFRTYADKSHDVMDILVHAQNDVFFAMAVGDRFIEKYLYYLESLLARGVNIYYMLLTKEKLKEAEAYMQGKNIDISFRDHVIEELSRLKKKYPERFHLREFDAAMTASYIGVDVLLNRPDRSYISSSAIQTMLYQYKTQAENSPITYMLPQKDEKEFLTTVKCMKQMWGDAKPL